MPDCSTGRVAVALPRRLSVKALRIGDQSNRAVTLRLQSQQAFATIARGHLSEATDSRSLCRRMDSPCATDIKWTRVYLIAWPITRTQQAEQAAALRSTNNVTQSTCRIRLEQIMRAPESALACCLLA